MKFKKFKKIGQFKDSIVSIKSQSQYVGKDENGESIYDETRCLPTVVFKGTVKLHGCVSQDTLVIMADGSQVPISDLRVGDSIISYNEKEKKEEFDVVTNVISDDLDKDWLKLSFSNGSELECTEDHPIFTKNRGYVKAVDLREEDILINFQ